MNCDTAFDLMTDAHGSRSGALAQHFNSCPRCRRMQEALSPALDFLVEGSTFDGGGNHAKSDVSSSQAPIVTTEAVQVASRASVHLAAHSEKPRVRLARLASRTGKYAAAFAAGLLLAVVLFSQRDRGTPPAAAACTRREVLKDNQSRTTDQIQALVHSCAVCHQSSSPGRNDQSTINPTRNRSWDWLIPLIEQRNQPPADDSLNLPMGPIIAACEEPFRMHAGDA